VRIEARVDPSDPPLDAIRSILRRAWIAERRERAIDDAVDAVIARWVRRSEG
jgi:hypothetical protein